MENADAQGGLFGGCTQHACLRLLACTTTNFLPRCRQFGALINEQNFVRFCLSELPKFGKPTHLLLPARFSLAASSSAKLELPLARQFR